MSLLIKHDWNDDTVNWLEEHLQQAIVSRLKQMDSYGDDFVVVGDMNAAKRSKTMGARLKAAGMTAGEPDLRVYIDCGVMLFIELKRGRGKLSKVQVDWHKQLHNLGFKVHVVNAITPDDAVAQVKRILMDVLMDEEKM